MLRYDTFLITPSFSEVIQNRQCMSKVELVIEAAHALVSISCIHLLASAMPDQSSAIRLLPPH